MFLHLNLFFLSLSINHRQYYFFSYTRGTQCHRYVTPGGYRTINQGILILVSIDNVCTLTVNELIRPDNTFEDVCKPSHYTTQSPTAKGNTLRDRRDKLAHQPYFQAKRYPVDVKDNVAPSLSHVLELELENQALKQRTADLEAHGETQQLVL